MEGPRAARRDRRVTLTSHERSRNGPPQGARKELRGRAVASRASRIALLALLVTGTAVALAYRDRLDPGGLEAWVSEAGPVVPLLFMLGYALATVFFLPGSALTLAGGALFGPVLGTLYNLTGGAKTRSSRHLPAHIAGNDVRCRAAVRDHVGSSFASACPE